ncbi:MAG: hypothetical protein KAS32_27315 [Candidatus Peribacteraceae bacterium]|nr:hypothetical protein [Candidatus Peribacteraceae bacterium]
MSPESLMMWGGLFYIILIAVILGIYRYMGAKLVRNARDGALRDRERGLSSKERG